MNKSDCIFPKEIFQETVNEIAFPHGLPYVLKFSFLWLEHCLILDASSWGAVECVCVCLFTIFMEIYFRFLSEV